ncbi:MAG: hypothetical protein ACRD8W_30170 [Nitrososphaeraceae archaeon]
MFKKCYSTFIVILGGIILMALCALDPLLSTGGQVVAQNSSSQEEMISSSSSNSGIYTNKSNSTTNSQTLSIVEQRTEMSIPAPVRHPGQPLHAVVFALPLRDDGKIWSGKVTFTASKPIEVEVLHPYEPKGEVGTMHGEPYHAVLPGNKSIAISHLRDLVDVPIEINGTGISSGTLEFVGSALVFHKTTGQPFTVTYSIDAVAKSPINQN